MENFWWALVGGLAGGVVGWVINVLAYKKRMDAIDAQSLETTIRMNWEVIVLHPEETPCFINMFGKREIEDNDCLVSFKVFRAAALKAHKEMEREFLNADHR